MQEPQNSARLIQSYFRGYRIRKLLNQATKNHCAFEERLGLEFKVFTDQRGLLSYSQ